MKILIIVFNYKSVTNTDAIAYSMNEIRILSYRVNMFTTYIPYVVIPSEFKQYTLKSETQYVQKMSYLVKRNKYSDHQPNCCTRFLSRTSRAECKAIDALFM